MTTDPDDNKGVPNALDTLVTSNKISVTKK